MQTPPHKSNRHQHPTAAKLSRTRRSVARALVPAAPRLISALSRDGEKVGGLSSSARMRTPDLIAFGVSRRPCGADFSLLGRDSSRPFLPPLTPNLGAAGKSARATEMHAASPLLPPRYLRALRVSAVSPLLAALLLLTSCTKKEAAEAEAPAPVQVTAVTQDTIRRIVAGDGVLFPLDQRPLMPKIPAPVQKFYANRGDHVKEGQLLAVLENRDLKAAAAANKGQVDQAEANYRTTTLATVPEAVVKATTDVESAKQQLDAASKALESRKSLLAQGAIARKQVDDQQVLYAQAKAQLDSAQEHLRVLTTAGRQEQIATAQAQVESAKAQFQSAEAQISYSEIRSPIAGIVADRPVYAGDMASPGSPLFLIMDISRVVARINVPQAQADQVRVGQAAEVAVNGSDQPVTGKVTVVSPATDTNSTTVQVWVQIDNPGERLKPGASVHGKIVAEAFKAATVIPAAAILPGEEGGTAVLVISSDSVAHRRLVQLGVREGDRVQVLNGARPGEEVVIVGGLGIDDKAKVRVVDTTVKEPDEDENPEPDAKPSPAKDRKKDQKKDEAKPKGQ